MTDPRYVILSGSNLCKLLLLDPKTQIKDEAHLEKISMNKNLLFKKYFPTNLFIHKSNLCF